jgi:sugar phosphate isomerase/epimerase
VRIGFNTWSIARVPYQDFIPGLADIGYRAIAISVVPGYSIGGEYVANAASLDALSADDRRRIKDQFVERDLALPSIIGNQSLLHQDASANEAALARLRATIDLCVDLALPGASVPTLNTGIAGRSGEFETHQAQVLDRLGGLTDYARQQGVVICIEPHVGGAIDTIERAEAIVGAVDSPNLRLDFDVSHFEVQAVPMSDSVSRLAPLAAAAEIKDQLARPRGTADGWVEGNGSGEATAPDGGALKFQFLLGGEGDFDLPRYLKLMQQCGFHEPISFEASVQCQARPGYDGLAAARRTYEWMRDGWASAGIAVD